MNKPPLNRHICLRSHLVHLTVIFISVFIAYHGALDSELVFDDEVAIIKNADVRPNSSILNLFKNDYWGTPLNSHLSHKSYRPLTVLTFRLNYLVHKLNPFGYHLVNLVLHGISSSLVYRLSLNILKSSTNSFLASLFFTLHPVHSDAVISVVGRAELLSSIFYLIGLILITENNLTVIYSKKKYLIGSLACGCLGFLCKEQCLMLLPLLACFILLDNVQMYFKETSNFKKLQTSKQQSQSSQLRHPLASANFKFFNLLIQLFLSLLLLNNSLQHHQLQKILRKRNKIIWFIVLCFTSILILRLNAHGQTLTVNFNALDQINFDDRASQDVRSNHTNKANQFYEDNKTRSNLISAFLTSAYVVASNFWLLFYPDRLSCDWSYGSIEPVLDFSDHKNLFSISLISLYVLPFSFLLLDFKTTKYRDLYIKLFLLIIVPFTPVLALRTGFVLAERVLYLPSIGYCILILFIYENYLDRNKTRLPKGSKIVFILSIFLMFNAMKIKCQERTSDWKNEKSLLESTLRTHPNNVKMLTNMGKLLQAEGQLTDAIFNYKQALSIHRGYLRAYGLLGELYYEQNQTEKALTTFLKARDQVMFTLHTGKQIAPESLPILIRLEELLQLHVKYDQSVQNDILNLYRRLNAPFVQLRPEEAYNLAIILRSGSNVRESIKVLEQNLKEGNLHFPSVKLYNELVKLQNAINHFRKAMELVNSENLSVSNDKADEIRYHLKRSLFYDSSLVQSYYNLALLDYKHNSLYSSRQYLNSLLNLQPDHFKANLMLCDLNLEIDQNLFDAVRCYTNLLDSVQLNRVKKSNDDSRSEMKISSSTNSKDESSNRKIFSLARHNLCSVLELINDQAIKNNATMNLSARVSCSDFNVQPTDNPIQQIQFHQLSIKST